ncbi:MAG: flagellar hook capping FlgD N-terminal domain-containing protein [Terriglobales bacterium]
MLHPATQMASTSSTASSPATTSSSSSSNPGVDLTSTFMRLLTVQLQNQSPLNPLDPNAFVTQLAQFDSLGELTQIQQLMQTLVNAVRPTSIPTSGASANANANSTSSPSLNSVAH